MIDHVADVRRYDSGADAQSVAKIVRYLGIALRNRDSASVSCIRQSELDRIRDKWCMKKLKATDAGRCDVILKTVCRTMAADRIKNRVTFYYLVAKHLGALDRL